MTQTPKQNPTPGSAPTVELKPGESTTETNVNEGPTIKLPPKPLVDAEPIVTVPVLKAAPMPKQHRSLVATVTPWLLVVVTVFSILFFFLNDRTIFPMIAIFGAWARQSEIIGAGPLWYCLLMGLLVCYPSLRGNIRLTMLEKWLIRAAAGSVVMSALFFLTSLGGIRLAELLSYGSVLWPAAFGICVFVEWRHTTQNYTPVIHETWTVWQMILSLLVTQCVLLTFAAVPAPPLLYDVTEYHLGALADYGMKSVTISPAYAPVPNNFFARFPFPIEALYHASHAPKMLNALCVLACALLVYAWLERAGVPRAWRLLAALLVMGHPVMLEVNTDAMIDAPVALLVLTGIYTIMLGTGMIDNIIRVKLLPIAGFIVGGALCAKYTVPQLYLLPIAIFCLIPMTRMVRQNKQWKWLVLGVLAGMLPILLWYGKNLFWYGNPLEPFFQWVFRPNDSIAIAREQYYIQSHFPQSFLSVSYWTSLPIRVNALGWPLLAAILAYMLPSNIFARRDGWRLALMVIVTIMLWNLVRNSQSRFLLPAILMSIVAGTFAIQNIWHTNRRNADFLFVRGAAIVIAVLFGMTATAGSIAQWYKLARWNWLTYAFERGMEGESVIASDGKFYAKNLGALGEVLDEASTTTTLTNKGKLLLIYEARPWLWLHMMPNRWDGIIYNTVFDQSRFLDIVKLARTPDDINSALRKVGVSYVLVNNEELLRFAQQYARPAQLREKGVSDLIKDWPSIAEPEDFYAPFSNDSDWQKLRGSVLAWLRAERAKAVIVKGRPEIEVWLAPVD